MGQEPRSMLKSFRDLQVWQRSIQLAVAVYRLAGSFPREEMYGLSSQMRRAAVSVASNIAEGYGRLGVGEYRQFLGIARGSTLELQTQFEIARALGMGESKLVDEAEELSHEVCKMLYAMLDKLKVSRGTEQSLNPKP
jgi:four helix bundle protein